MVEQAQATDPQVEHTTVQSIAPSATVQTQKLDIILLSHGRLDLTLRAINALYENTQVPFHLVIVDNSEEMDFRYLESIAKEKGNITIYHQDGPFNNGNQMFNIGLERTETEFVGIIMNSIRVEPEWEIVAMNLLQHNPKVGLIGFKNLLQDGTIESAGIKMVNWLPTDIGRGWPGHRLSNVYEPDAVQWAFCMVRREAAIGNLTENTFHGFVGWDDIDNCFALKDKGWRILYCGLGAGYHQPRATRGSNSKEAEQANRENGIAFYKRWGFWDKFVAQHGEDAPIHRQPGAGSQPVEGNKQIPNELLTREVVD